MAKKATEVTFGRAVILAAALAIGAAVLFYGERYDAPFPWQVGACALIGALAAVGWFYRAVRRKPNLIWKLLCTVAGLAGFVLLARLLPNW